MKKVLRVPGIATLMLMLGTAVGTAQQISIDNAVQNSAWGLSSGIDRGTRVVVLAVESTSFTMSEFLVNEVTAALIGLQAVEGFTVVPGSEVNQAIMGLPISTSSFVTNAMAQSVGRLLNAHFVVIGTFEPIAGFFRFRVQLVEVNTANVRSIHTHDVLNDAVVAHFMGGALWAGTGARTARAGAAQTAFASMPVNWISWGWYGVGGANFRYQRNRSDTTALGLNIFYGFNPARIGDSGSSNWSSDGYRSLDNIGGGFTFGLTGTARVYPGLGRFFFMELGLGLGVMEWWERWWYHNGQWGWGDNMSWHSNVGLMINPAIGYRLGGRRRWTTWNWGWFWDLTVAVPIVIGTGGVSARFSPGAALGIAW
ncbi:MAG: hypothetical protein FWC64_10605 [Treponema sp.]|nr:hypothetical protein [Treponema sp.]